MKPTMHILANYLSGYNITIDIKDGTRQIKYIRVGEDKVYDYANTLLIKKVFNGGDIRYYRILCTYGDDSILINNVTNSSDILNEILKISEKFIYAEEEYNKMIYSGTSLNEFLQFSADFIGEPIVMSDTCFHLIDSSEIDYTKFNNNSLSSYIKDKILSQKLLMILCRLRNKEKTNPDPYVFEGNGEFTNSIISRINYNNKYSANLFVIECYEPLTKGQIQITKYISEMLEKFLEVNELESNLSPETRVFTDLMNDVVLTDADIISSEKLIGWGDNDTKFLMKLVHNNKPCTNTDMLYSLIENLFFNCYTIIYEDSIIVITNIETASKLSVINRISDLIADDDYCLGISYNFNDIRNIKKYYVQATLAINYGRKKGKKINHCEHYLLPYTCKILHDNLSTDIIHPAIIVLRDYDQMHNTDLYNTLNLFLRYERNLVITASKLCIHRNSLIYRINKIYQLTSLDLDDPSLRTFLRICFLVLSKETDNDEYYN